ncbi:MAG: nucleoside kinase [Paludibacteraceae bacterium]|nr:nucleoside kinase [Paludibacteraceae bacterium]
MTTEQTVEIYCVNNGVTKDYPVGTSLLEIYKDLGLQLKYGVIAAKANNKIKDLKFCVYKPKILEFIGIDCSAGMSTYVRSLCFVLYKAVKEVFPRAFLRIEHPVSKGYYCRILKEDKSPVTQEDIDNIKENINMTILQDIPFVMEMRKQQEAIEIFKKDNAMDKVNLIRSLHSLYVRIYRLSDVYDYYYGPLAPSTNYLKIFDLRLFNDGLLLMIPNRSTPVKLEDFEPQEKMFYSFQETAEYQSIMNVDNLGDINLVIDNKDKNANANKVNAPIMIMVAEALQDKKIAMIADQIAILKKVKLILISGPSSSGKTTFSKKLSIQLGTNMLRPFPLSLDNYFLPRKDTPRDEKGDYDFESLYALDLDLFNKQMIQLINGEEVDIPYFNFETGEREYRGDKIKMNPDNLLIIEGIHGLNPDLTSMIPDENKFKIYVSALTTLSLDDHNWIPTADSRLLRRIVRDFNFRGYSAEETIRRWDKVRQGENKWIFPYQENADVIFNSALLFEIPVIKKYAEPILMEVPQDHPEFGEAHRLLKFLRYFKTIPDSEIPLTSVLREFVGGSNFHY